MSVPDKRNKSRFIPVGSTFTSGLRVYRCIERKGVNDFREACAGCWFSVYNKTCPKFECSSFARPDRKNVWFIEEKR